MQSQRKVRTRRRLQQQLSWWNLPVAREVPVMVAHAGLLQMVRRKLRLVFEQLRGHSKLLAEFRARTTLRLQAPATFKDRTWKASETCREYQFANLGQYDFRWWQRARRGCDIWFVFVETGTWKNKAVQMNYIGQLHGAIGTSGLLRIVCNGNAHGI